jgi:hypothetical protein
MSMPPNPGKNSADNICHYIPGIANRPAHNVRSNYLKENGPDHQVERDFARCRRQIVLAQFQPALHQQ